MAFSLDLGNLLVHLSLKTAQFDRMLKTSERKLLNIAGGMQRVGRTMTMGLTLPIVGIGAAAVKSFASFDDAMTKSTAIMGNLSKEMRNQLEKTALTLSKKSVTSANELARSYFYLASAGLDAQQSLAALPVVEKFAVAGAFDMALATDLVTDAQSALGMTVKDTAQNMKNMTKVANSLIAANTLANATTEQFSRALTTEAAAMMKYNNIALEEGLAVLAAYADQGIKAEHAGSMFGRMLRLMTQGFMNNRKAWKQFGISIYDARENLRPLNEIISDLTGLLYRMTPKQRAVTLNMLGFQARSQQTITPLLGLGDAIKNYEEKLKELQTVLDEIYQKQLKSFSSQMKILWNNVVAVGKEIGKILAPSILVINEHIKDGLKWWESLNKATKGLIVDMGLMAAAIGPVLLLTGSLLKMIILFKIAAIAAAGAVATLTAAIAIAGTAMASWRIGKWMRENYEWFAIWHEKLAETITAIGVHLVFAFKDASLKVKMYWSKLLGWFRSEWAAFLRDLAKALRFAEGKIGKDLGSFTLFKSAMEIERGVKDGTAEYQKAIQENIKEYNRQLAFLTETVDQTIESIKAKFAEGRNAPEGMGESIAKLKERAAKLVEDMRKIFGQDGGDGGLGLGKFIQENMTTFHTYLTNATDTWNRLGEVGAGAVDGLSDALSQLAITGKADMKKLALSVLTELNRVIIKMLVAKAIMSALGISPMPGAGGAPIGGAGGAVAPTVTPSAMGNLFSAGKVVPFQRGGMIDGPTVFPLADNTLGVAGERGKEMLAPVTRMPTGEMGVKSQPSPTVVNLKTVNVFDKSEIVGAMDSEEGERVLLNIMRRKGLM